MQTDKFLEGLNKEQLQAVIEKNGPILVLAGAGSGKTKVLTSRIAYLIKEGINPNEILAVTFTNKAAKEMQQRLGGYLGENIVKRMWVGTFHNICGRILRRDLENYKTKDGRHWNNNYVIYDDSDTKTIIKNILKKLNLDEKIYNIKTIKASISNAKNKMQDAYTFASYARDYYNQKVSQIYYDYEKELALNNAIDFDDMLLLSVNLLKENEEIRKKYELRFKHILADEFQDTNKAQYDLINMFYPVNSQKDLTGSLCAVGDIDQSIYSWRGADFKIILNFQNDYKNTKLIKLEQNYRSTENILQAANYVIKNNEERLEKNLYSNKGKGEKIALYEAPDDFSESRYIAKKIEDLNIDNDKIAILYRTNAQSRSIEEALISYSIPYKIAGGLKFYDRKEIKDIIAYLKLIYNHNDSQSFKRIINEPKRSIGETTIKKLSDFAGKNDISLYVALNYLDKIDDISAKTKSILENFKTMLDEITSYQSAYNLSDYVDFVLEKTGYISSLTKEESIENESRIENLKEFINVVKEFEEDDFNLDSEDDLGILGNFLSQVALVSDIDEIKEDEKTVTLMTLHCAKGLEYPYVFIAGLEDGIFPHLKNIIQGQINSELEEERRLMYVGITRAKEKLFLTYAKRRKVWGNYQTYPKSRFLDEIPSSLIEEENEKSDYTQSRTSFSSAVSKVKERKNDFSKTTLSNNFASSLARIKQSAQKAKNTTDVNITKKIEPDKKNDNLNIKDMILKAKQKASSIPQNQSNNRIEGFLPVGTRVFHITFGVGKIVEIKKESSNYNYVVEFTKSGQKTLDCHSSNLKTF